MSWNEAISSLTIERKELIDRVKDLEGRLDRGLRDHIQLTSEKLDLEHRLGQRRADCWAMLIIGVTGWVLCAALVIW